MVVSRVKKATSTRGRACGLPVMAQEIVDALRDPAQTEVTQAPGLPLCEVRSPPDDAMVQVRTSEETRL